MTAQAAESTSVADGVVRPAGNACGVAISIVRTAATPTPVSSRPGMENARDAGIKP